MKHRTVSILSLHLKKVLILIGSVVLLSMIVFFISRMTPMDPLRSYYGERVEKMSEVQKQEAEERLGLHDAIPVQYVRWITAAVQGDPGISYKYKQNSLEVITSRAGNTMLLGGLSFVLTFGGAAVLGLFCAMHENSLFDRLLTRLSTIFSCIPEFWMALILILLFGVSLHILPTGGAYSPGMSGDAIDRLKHLILPLSVTVLGHLGYYACIIRSRLLEEKKKAYVLLLSSEGMPMKQIMVRHCLKGALPSILSLMAVSVPHILGGTYVVEQVFSWPGLGTLAFESAKYADYNLLTAVSLLSGAAVIFLSLLAETAAECIDPRIRSHQVILEEERS